VLPERRGLTTLFLLLHGRRRTDLTREHQHAVVPPATKRKKVAESREKPNPGLIVTIIGGIGR
jgi:hypothetical protein